LGTDSGLSITGGTFNGCRFDYHEGFQVGFACDIGNATFNNVFMIHNVNDAGSWYTINGATFNGGYIEAQGYSHLSSGTFDCDVFCSWNAVIEGGTYKSLTLQAYMAQGEQRASMTGGTITESLDNV